MKIYSQMQMGKNGVTESFISTLETHFKNHKNVNISVLKSAVRDKEKIKEYSKEIIEKLGKNYTAKIIGFTISLKKWRKEIKKT